MKLSTEGDESLYRFGPFCLDAGERMLLRDGRRVPLAPKALTTLLVLVRNVGHVVEKDVLMAEVWPDEDVEEGNLAQHVFTLRKALGESNGSLNYIETIPRRGYRFVAPVIETREENAEFAENGNKRITRGSDTNELLADIQPIAMPPSETLEIAANALHFGPPPLLIVNSERRPELDSRILRGLAKNVDERYQSAEELGSDVRSIRSGLHDVSSNTLIQPRSSTISISTTRHTTLTNSSQMLRRPRAPLWYILVGLAVVSISTGIVWRWARPSLHVPRAEAKNWYAIGTNALRDGAFFQASKALERAIVIDDKYVLAHARLAESLVELDYTDRAKDELLRVTSLASDRSLLPKADVLYLEAISATVRHDFPAAIEFYTALVKLSSDIEKPQVLVDLGRAYEKNEDIKKAIETYAEVTNRNPQYATAFLRLGILYGRQRDLPNALSSFEKAEGIYEAMSNLEGRTEVVYQRGALFNQLQKLPEARTQLEQALAQAGDNTSQKIKTLLQLSTWAVDSGETARATEYAREAVDLAQRNGMENLSAQGLIDLGFTCLVRGEPDAAEKYFLQALALAQRVKARRNEARARAGMASLRQQQHKPDEVLKYLEPALAFYQQGGYSAATSDCLALLARANVQKGDYAAAQKAQEQLLRLGQQLKDQSLIAQAHEERGVTLAREEKFTEALDHFAQAFLIHNAHGVERSIGYNLLQRAGVLSSLGRYSEAQPLLDQAAAIADKPGGEMKRLSLAVKLLAAEIDLSQNRFADASDKGEKVLATAGTQFPVLSVNGLRVLGMAQAYGGATAAGKVKCDEAVDLAKQLNDPTQLARAQLTLAETLLLSGDSPGASQAALQAQAVFARLGQLASEWRALVVAALASRKLGDKNKAQEQALQAKDSLAKLEQRWSKGNYITFISRPDVQRLRKQLDQLTASRR